MVGVSAAEPAELAKQHPVWMRTFVFVGGVIAALALFAGKNYQLAWHGKSLSPVRLLKNDLFY